MTPSAWVLRSEIALRAGDSEGAKRHLENVLAQHPSVYSTHSTLDSLIQTERRSAELRAAAKQEETKTADDETRAP